jgi:hypothetical protein
MNLMQQDSVAMRMTMRLAYATVNPVTIMEPGEAITARWPFAALLPTGATAPGSGPIDVIQSNPYPYPGTYMADADAQSAAVDEAEQSGRQAWEEHKGREVTEGEPPARESRAARQEALRSGRSAASATTERNGRAERERRSRPSE